MILATKYNFQVQFISTFTKNNTILHDYITRICGVGLEKSEACTKQTTLKKNENLKDTNNLRS